MEWDVILTPPRNKLNPYYQLKGEVPLPIAEMVGEYMEACAVRAAGAVQHGILVLDMTRDKIVRLGSGCVTKTKAFRFPANEALLEGEETAPLSVRLPLRYATALRRYQEYEECTLRVAVCRSLWLLRPYARQQLLLMDGMGCQKRICPR